MEEIKAMFRVCAHTKKDGFRCNSPALKGGNFCYQHIGGSLRALTRAQSTYVGAKLDFLYPGDRQSIQHNLFVVAQAMNDGKIDLQTANTYNRIFSTCERNLRRWETHYQKPGQEKELSPVPGEAPDPAGKNAGRDSGQWTNGGPLKPDFGLSGEQKSSVSSASSVVNPSPVGEQNAVPLLSGEQNHDLNGEQNHDRFVSGQGFRPAESSGENKGASAPAADDPLKSLGPSAIRRKAIHAQSGAVCDNED